MQSSFEVFHQESFYPALFRPSYAFAVATALLILASVLFKFYQDRNSQAKDKKHPVATLTMAFVVYLVFPFLSSSIGQIKINDVFLVSLYFVTGIGLMAFGAVWHIWSKISLGRFWSDMIRTQQNQTIVRTGAYALARHPMYGSLFLWMIGASLAMFNMIAMAITFFMMLPMLVARAKAEEHLLLQSNPAYQLYKNNSRMLLPSLSGKTAFCVKVALIALLGYFIWVGISWPSLLYLFILHLLMGYSLQPEKTAFSYRSKSGMMIVIYAASLIWPPVYYLLWLILAMFIYGLFFNCPCMMVYEKYGRCPCFALLGKACDFKGKSS